MIGVELVRDRQTRSAPARERDAVMSAAFARGLLLLGAGANAIRFSAASSSHASRRTSRFALLTRR
jgi:4-aminobutyrate aminotransferase-like enzyme